MRSASVLFAVLLVLVLAAPAQAAQRYASPSGSGVACTQAAPCSLSQAVGAAATNDEVIVTGGAYAVGAPISTPGGSNNVFIHGDFAGAMPQINASISGAAPITASGVGSRLSYLDITNSAANAFAVICFFESSVDRLRATTIGASAIGVLQLGKCSVRDSVARADGENALAISASGSIGATTGLIRNVTAVATGANSIGIRSSYNEIIISGGYTLDVKNTIASGATADLNAAPGAFGSGHIVVTNSNFDAPLATPPATITGGPNQSAAPLFVNAAAGDYREAAGSPTIDAGSTDQIGSLDPDGRPRTLGAAPDIGAYEFVPPPGAPGAPAVVGTLKALSLKPTAFRTLNAGGAIFSKKAAPVGTTVNYSISAAATVSFKVERVSKGRKVGKKCKKATAANRDHKKCPLFKSKKPAFTHQGAAGANAFKFSGRIGGKPLPVGRYRLVASANGTIKRTAFRVVR